jgi:hypothetical protein
MKNRLAKVLLPAAIVAARMSCQAQQVYSSSVGSFFPAPQHSPDEISVYSYSFKDSSNETTCVEWDVSTNILARQPRWDGFSVEAPLSIRKACALALRPVRGCFPEVQSWSVNWFIMFNPYRDEPITAQQDIWCYAITLVPRDPLVRVHLEQQAASGAAETQIVLLDGTVVQPRVLKKK